VHALVLAKGAAALSIAGATVLGAQQGLDHGQVRAQTESASSTVYVYIVRPGDTLGAIAARYCGSPARYPSLAAASHISNPNVIRVGQRIVLSCYRHAVGPAATSSGDHEPDGDSDDHTSTISGSSYAQGSANIPATSRVYSFVGLERLWIGAGGSSARAYTAACIAEHESGGRSWAVSPTNDWGLWQIHAGGYAMLNPYANTARAVAMSSNGRNWSQWTTHGMCGV